MMNIRFSSLATVAGFAVCLLLWPGTIAAQQKKKHVPIQKNITVVPPKKPSVPVPGPWQITYKVTVKGEGEYKPDKFKSKVFTIDRTYEGIALFDHMVTIPKVPKITPEMSQREMVQAALAAQGSKIRMYSTIPVGEKMFRNMDVTINDRVTEVDYLPGEGGSYVQTTTTTEWTSLGGEFAFNGGQLEIDLDAQKYTFTMSIKPGNSLELVTVSSVSEIERSGGSRGGKTTVDKKSNSTQVRTSSIDIPRISGYLEDGVIKRTEDFDLGATEFEWDSGDLTPSDPVFPGIPDSRSGVKVKIVLTYKKLPPKQ